MAYPKIVSAVAAGVLIGLATSTSAGAQVAPTPTYIGMTPQDVGVLDRARPEYDAKGIPMGGFRLFPVLDVTGNYDDNIFRQPAGLSDYFFSIAPSARLQSQWGRHFVELYSGLNYFAYTDHTEQNLVDWNVGGDGRLDISRAAMVRANAWYGYLHETWSSPNNIVGFQASPNRYFQTHVEASGVLQPNRLGFGLGGSYDRFNWQNTPRLGGGFLFNPDRNEDTYQGYAKVFYDFSPGYSAFVRANYETRQFDMKLDRSGLDRSSHGYRVQGGVNLQITHLVSGELYLGYLDQTFAKNGAATLRGVAGLDYGAQLDWYALPVLTVHLSGNRQLVDVVLAGVSVADNKNVSVSADYEFRPNIILQARASYTSSRYVGQPFTDNYPGAGVGVRYLINRYVSADVNYNYSERSVDAARSAARYTDNTVSAGLTFHL